MKTWVASLGFSLPSRLEKHERSGYRGIERVDLPKHWYLYHEIAAFPYQAANPFALAAYNNTQWPGKIGFVVAFRSVMIRPGDPNFFLLEKVDGVSQIGNFCYGNMRGRAGRDPKGRLGYTR